MIQYFTPGVFPAPWNDFLSVEKGPDERGKFPFVSLSALPHAVEEGWIMDDKPIVEGIYDDKDGSFEIVLDVPEITLEVAQEWLAAVNNVKTEDISLEVKATCLSF